MLKVSLSKHQFMCAVGLAGRAQALEDIMNFTADYQSGSLSETAALMTFMASLIKKIRYTSVSLIDDMVDNAAWEFTMIKEKEKGDTPF